MENTNHKKLFLDDLRTAPEDFVQVYSYEEFRVYIEENGVPEFISFDHDLGEGKSGFDCAKFLVDYCLDKNIHNISFTVHSQNPVGKENIISLLSNFNKRHL